MNPDPATRAFVIYQRTGDPVPLGAVFDAVAPELLLVAARLLPRNADAGDIVQKTFLTAIAKRRRFDGKRPVAAWLCGILVRHVGHERRRLRRRLDATRLPSHRPAAPDEVAASVEVAERVRESIGSLPQPYRQVLRMHLVHGLAAHEVAAGLERPYRTVQSQLRRGLDLLRKVLPGLGVVPAANSAALSDVRVEVMAAARVRATAALAPWWKLAAAAAFLAPATALWVAATTDTAAIPLAESTRVSRWETRPGWKDEVPAPARSRRPAQDPQPVCRSRVRVVAHEDTTPLPGVVVRVALQDRDPRGRWSGNRRLDPLTTDTRGEVAFELPRGRGRRMTIELTAHGRLTVVGDFAVPDREEFAFEDVALRRLVRGRIRVRDQHGAPVGGLTVRLGGGLTAGFRPLEPLRATTGDDGWTETIDLPLGETCVTLRGVPVAFAAHREVSLELDVRGGDQQIELRRPGREETIAGRVLDDAGEPMAGAWVQLVRARDGVPLVLGRGGRYLTDAGGRFALPVPDGIDGPFRILAGLERASGQTSESAWEAGADDAIVRLRWPPGFRLHVVDVRDGRPVEDFGVVCFRVDDNGVVNGDRSVRFEGYHPDGTVFVEGVETGGNRLLVLPPEDSPYLPSGYLPVSVGGPGGRITVELHRPAPIPVKLVDADGGPVAGSGVRLLAKLAEDADARHATRIRGVVYGSSHWMHFIELAVARTDASGRAELQWQPWHEPVVVRAEGPGHLVREVELPSIHPGGEPIVLRVAPGATVRGRVASIDRWPELAVDSAGQSKPVRFEGLRPRIVLRDAATGALEDGPRGDAFPIRVDGTFVCPDVPPGRWQVLLRWNRPSASGVGATVEVLRKPLAELVATARREDEVTFDLADVLPGSLRGRVFLDGEPRQPERILRATFGVDHLGRPKGRGGLIDERFVLPDGGYRIAGIPPGEVQVEAWFDGRRYRLLERIPLAPDEDKEVDLRFRRLVARIRLVTAGGDPVRSRLVRIGGEFCTTDGSGWTQLDPVPALDLDVWLYAPGIDRNALYERYDDPRVRPVEVGRIQLDPARARSEHVLTVPDTERR